MESVPHAPAPARDGVSRFFRLSRIAAAVLIVMTAGSIGLFFTIRAVVASQENKILEEHASDLALTLDESVQSVGTLLPLAGVIQSGGYTHSFQTLAHALAGAKGAAVVAFGRKGSGWAVLSKVGSGPTALLASPQARPFLDRAASSAQLVSALLQGKGSRLLVLGVAAPGHRVVVDAGVVAEKVVPATVPPGTGFSGVDLALYAAASPRPAYLVAADNAMPSGDVNRQYLDIGADRWLLVTSASQPLVGTVAAFSPWFALIAGMVAALLATGIVEGLGRRREYALQLVAERTATLEAALAERSRLQEAEQQAREEAEAANRSKNEFISRMSHELRTPLNAVLGFGQLLERDELTEEQLDSVDHILKGGHHLLGLINEILDISRIESGDLALSEEPVHVGELFADATSLVRPLADQRSINLVGGNEPDCDVYVFADRQRLQQVVLNLLSNAVKYNRVGGTVAVSCEQATPTTARLKVSDTGPGITEEQLGRLFTPFDRLGAERTEVEGTGIGLALSRRLAEAMGGTLDLETTAGVGSTFWVELPLVEAPLDRYERLRPGARATSDGRGPTTARRRILYIEDNLANLTLVQRIAAERPGLEIVPAMQGRLGLELAREHAPALVLLDLHLPDINGDEVLQHLRHDPVTASTPVVIVSADATQSQIQRLLNAGATAYLTKPFDVAELLRIIDEHAGVG